MTTTMNWKDYDLWFRRFEMIKNDVRLLGNVIADFKGERNQILKAHAERAVLILKESENGSNLWEVPYIFGFIVGKLNLEKDGSLWILLIKGGEA